MLAFIDSYFTKAGGLIGASNDELKLVFSFLLSYPLAGVLKRVPDDKPWAKNLFTIFVSLFYLVGLFDLWDGLGVLLACAGGTYGICLLIQGPYMPWINFVFLMGYMSISHIYRQIKADASHMDITGAQMVLVMKLTAFAWNVFDGTQKPEYLDENQKTRALKGLPSILNYLGYVFFFPSLLIGPAFDFADYRSWIETSMFDLPPGVDPSKAPATRKKRRIPRSGTPATYRAVIGLAWILAFLVFDGYYNPGVVLAPSYGGYGFLRRVWLLHMMSMVFRFRYYGAFSLTEGACILSGIGYKGVDPKTGKADWSRLQNMNPFGVELAQNSHAYLGNWNMNTNSWLRNYVYLRVTPRGKKPGFRATLATFVTSAFWHGFYPGYYLSFVLASFIQNVSKNSRRLLRPFFMAPDGKTPLPSKRYYDFLSYFLTQVTFSFTTAPFILLGIHDSLKVWSQVYFYAILGVIACNVFLLTPGKAWLSSNVKAYQRTAGRPAAQRQDSYSKETYLGLPNDPGKEWDNMVDEIANEIERRRSDGKPIKEEVKQVLREKFGDKLVQQAEAKKLL